MKSYFRLIFLSLLILATPILADGVTPFLDLQNSDAGIEGNQSNNTFALIGDTQKTLPFEEEILGRETNDRERELLIRHLATENIQFLGLLGDMTSFGARDAQWEYFDVLMQPFRNKAIPVLAAVGNHDYMGNTTHAMANLHARFPQLEKGHWYSRQFQSLGLIWLDSNSSQLTSKEWSEEQTWLKQSLGQMEANAAIKGILIFEHHPPFTNSTVTGDGLDIQKAFVPTLIHSPKVLGMITGHAHGYEHFLIQNKHFIISAGGGGPRVTLKTGTAARHQDLYNIPTFHPAPRPFNYLIVQTQTEGVDITVKGLEKGASEVHTIDHYFLKF